MSKYILNKKIHSCTVDKDLLINLENCILDRVINKIIGEYINDEMIEKYNNYYTISIKEKNGLEEFESIKDYKQPLLPNETKEVELNVSLNIPDIAKNNIGLSYIYININFSNSFDKKIIVNIKSENKSKQIALNIYNLIKETIENNYNNNFIFHLPSPYNILGYFFYLSLSAAGIYYESGYILNIFFLLVHFFVFYYLTIRLFFKPYIEFKTNKSNNRKKTYEIIRNIFIGIFIIGISVEFITNFLL